MTINPADLNDPVKAEAFLRETLAGLDADIADIEGDAAKQIARIEKIRDARATPLKQRRDEIRKLLDHADALKHMDEKLQNGEATA